MAAFPQTFHGSFDVKVVHEDAALHQQLLVERSAGSDGTYPGEVGQEVHVEGEEWTLDLRWLHPDGAWRSSLIKRDVEYTVEDGLVYVVRAQIGSPGAGMDFHHLWVTVTSADPEVNPMHPPALPPDFTFPKS
jgi:hypothetical protein